jgi:hypothetical protein
LIRAVFVNAGAFFSFELSMRALGRSEESQWFLRSYLFYNSKNIIYNIRILINL